MSYEVSAKEQDAPGSITVRRMDAYEREIRDEVAALLVEGFFPKLAYFTKNRRKLALAFRDGIRADMFYVAELDGAVVGMLGCSSDTRRALVADKTLLRRSLGFLMGSVAYAALKGSFNAPLHYGDGNGYVEWVATAERARGRGVSTALFRHVMDRPEYGSLTLEVLDFNENAFRLYRKLGFVEYDRKAARGMERQMFKERILMRWDKD
ncbi:GNAT family N-acetyltransferase [Glycomyces sp. A-F 0318]|uniref:GNAT family N-acetyltransferase n=1 Tax=Glycomyces amatae TaxID=2881355 RepID=UPI001E323CBC|nr:GNAT family N-acetyltransferase [Glycomyces amatae]MCD0446490.1 GNAT family N-acetyltransferase [Glycomyces amatae]